MSVKVQMSIMEDKSLSSLIFRVQAVLETILNTVNGGSATEIISVTQFVRDDYYFATIYWRVK